MVNGGEVSIVLLSKDVGKLRYELTLYLGFIALVSKAFVNHP